MVKVSVQRQMQTKTPFGSTNEKQARLNQIADVESYRDLLWKTFEERFGFEQGKGLRTSKANGKTGAPSFNLVAGISCPKATKTCLLACYAQKGRFNMDAGARMGWENYLALLKMPLQSWPDALRSLVMSSLGCQRRGFFRLHASGDFFEQKYLDIWIEVAKKLPRVQFWAYTRSFNLDFSALPRNLVVYASADRDNLEQAKDFAKQYGLKLAFMGRDVAEQSNEKFFGCPQQSAHGEKVEDCVDCELCVFGRGKHVMFALH